MLSGLKGGRAFILNYDTKSENFIQESSLLDIIKEGSFFSQLQRKEGSPEVPPKKMVRLQNLEGTPQNSALG